LSVDVLERAETVGGMAPKMFTVTVTAAEVPTLPATSNARAV